MPKIIQTTVYTLDELEPRAKERARDWYRECISGEDWWDALYEDFEALCEIIGLELKPNSLEFDLNRGGGVGFQGTYTYKPNAVESIRAYSPGDRELLRIVDSFVPGRAEIGPRMEIDSPSEANAQALRDLAAWLLRQLRNEYEYQNSDEVVDENILVNEYTFTKQGVRFG